MSSPHNEDSTTLSCSLHLTSEQEVELYRHCRQHDTHYGMQLQYAIILLCVAMNSSTPLLCAHFVAHTARCRISSCHLAKIDSHLISKSIKCTILLKIICKLEGISIASYLTRVQLYQYSKCSQL